MDPKTLLITILVAPILASLINNALAPIFAGLTADKAARGASKARKRRALDSIKGHPRARVGARIDSIRRNASGGYVELPIGACTISKIDLGLIDVVNDKGQSMNFGVEEWVHDLDPLYAGEA